MYTTHYLPELADLGATLAVARAGKVIARGSPHTLINGLPGELRLRFDGQDPGGVLPSGAVPRPALPAALAGRASNVDGEVRIASTNPPADLACLLAAGCSPISVDVRRPDLDDLYRALALEVQHAA